MGERKTTAELEGVPYNDPRWIMVCNFLGCKNILQPDEMLVCNDHPKLITSVYVPKFNYEGK